MGDNDFDTLPFTNTKSGDDDDNDDDDDDDDDDDPSLLSWLSIYAFMVPVV